LFDNKIEKYFYDFTGCPNIVSLTIMHWSALDFSSIRFFRNLKELTITYSYIDELGWLENVALLNKFVCVECAVESIDGIQFQTELEYLDLDSNNISDISKIESLNNLQKLNLFRNKITDDGMLRSKNIKELVINEKDRDIKNLHSKVECLIDETARYINSQKSLKDEDIYPYLCKILQLPVKERMEKFITARFEDLYLNLSPNGFYEYEDSYKNILAEMAREKFPFLINQIQEVTI
jgi:Leucine-rich repeat (LRR) protein